MKVKFLPALRENRCYEGVIRKYEVKEGMLRIYVELSDEPDNLYLCSQRMIMRLGSPFYRFCKDMGVFESGAELDSLIGLLVWAAFKKGSDGNMYISEMYAQEEEEEEDDDEE